MSYQFSFFLLLLTKLAAAAEARRAGRATLSVFCLVQASVSACWWFGERGPYYGLEWLLGSATVLFACVLLLREAGATAEDWKLGTVYASLVTAIGTYGLASHSWQLATPAEGAWCALFGFVFLRCSARRSDMAVLGALSIFTSAYDFGLLRNDWGGLDDWLPSASCAAAFGAVAVLVRRSRIPSRGIA